MSGLSEEEYKVLTAMGLDVKMTARLSSMNRGRVMVGTVATDHPTRIKLLAMGYIREVEHTPHLVSYYITPKGREALQEARRWVEARNIRLLPEWGSFPDNAFKHTHRLERAVVEAALDYERAWEGKSDLKPAEAREPLWAALAEYKEWMGEARS